MISLLKSLDTRSSSFTCFTASYPHEKPGLERCGKPLQTTGKMCACAYYELEIRKFMKQVKISKSDQVRLNTLEKRNKAKQSPEKNQELEQEQIFWKNMKDFEICKVAMQVTRQWNYTMHERQPHLTVLSIENGALKCLEEISGISSSGFLKFQKPERKTKQSLFACLRFIANDFGQGLRSGVYSLCYHETEIHAYFLRFCRTSSGYEFAEQVQDMNLQPKVVRMAEMEELRVEVKGESRFTFRQVQISSLPVEYDITLEGYITRLETVRHVELEVHHKWLRFLFMKFNIQVWHHFRRLYYSAGDVRRVKLEGLRSDIYLQCNQSLNQEPYEFSGTMKQVVLQNKFSIRISNKTSLDGRIFDEVELITKKIIIKERQSVHFTVVVVIPFGISPEKFEDKFTACGVDL
ncbi:unnamed protein product [Brassica oleracea var. botrytis]|uniref:Uncharacterized protein n=1 Tax=Brassica oleracea TaxID=3712 RepID=A0A3P6E4C6_BRAOL|nr:unnamed protein product [Brassica oleracea]